MIVVLISCPIVWSGRGTGVGEGLGGQALDGVVGRAKRTLTVSARV
jgi:hypothetical protein